MEVGVGLWKSLRFVEGVVVLSWKRGTEGVVRSLLLGVWAVGNDVEDLRLWAVAVACGTGGGGILPERMSRTLL